MFRIWAKMIKDNRLLRDLTISDDRDVNRTAKVFAALDEVCAKWDLPKPIWLQSNVKDFRYHSKTRFTADSFIEGIDFDFLEIYVIEED